MIGMFPPGPDGRMEARSTSPWRGMIEDARSAAFEELRPGDEKRLFYTRKPWKRVIVMFAGPVHDHPVLQGTIKSAVAVGALLSQGIGDTIRVSLSAPPVEEIKVGIQILESLNLRQRGLEIVSCPSCGRAQVDVYKLAEEVTAGLEGMEVPLRVAVMGCVVNGPGEAREADLGVASGNGKGQIFVKGEVIKTVPESKIVETLIEEAMKIAEQMEKDGVTSGEPSVSIAG
ncbi:4-hydroxy-3-methylbut-2-en-1-yl diphosphate synthase (flavodoxin) [Streptomyces tendae]